MLQKSGVQILYIFLVEVDDNSAHLHAHSKWNTIFFEVSLSKSIREVCQSLENSTFFNPLSSEQDLLEGFQSANHANSQQKDELQEGGWPPMEFGRFFLVDFSCYVWGTGSRELPEDGEEN